MRMKSGFGMQLLLSLPLLFAFCSCDSDSAKEDLPNEKDLLWNIVPALPSSAEGFAGLEQYGVSLYCFNQLSSECLQFQNAESFSSLKSFTVEKAAYSIVAFLADKQSADLSYDASSNARKSDFVTVHYSEANLPDLVLASASVTKDVTANVELSSLERMVGGLNISFTDVPEDVTSVELTLNNLYDEFNFNGMYGFSTGSSVSKKILMTRSGTTFSCSSVTLPTDTEISELPINVTLYRGSDTDNYKIKLVGGVVADKVATLEGTVKDMLVHAGLSFTLTYAPWNDGSQISDGITVGGDVNKQWSSAVLPIGGKSGQGYDNFWASSSLVNDWAAQYDSYLYDGIKDLDHKDEYWGPDASYESSVGTIPCWYINLGGNRQGVTITYWNKFGGAGGQKIRTMKIYGSNNVADYGGGNTDWKLITTFTSDKTKPTVDAGAEVTTGRIDFNEGKTSYHFLKCEITSRVSNTGDVIEDSDVNVSEVNITVWSCK